MLGKGTRGSRLSGGQGRGGGPNAAGPGGSCLCPSCGHRQPHVPGQPCTEIKCPRCGARM